jgi:hypothetical protein
MLPLLAGARQAEDLSRFHGTNERIATANWLKWCASITSC